MVVERISCARHSFYLGEGGLIFRLCEGKVPSAKGKVGILFTVAGYLGLACEINWLVSFPQYYHEAYVPAALW